MTSTEQIFAPGLPPDAAGWLPRTLQRQPRPSRGRRSRQEGRGRAGVFMRAIKPVGPPRDLALTATLRRAALRRTQPGSTGPLVQSVDWRVKLRRSQTGNLILFVVDASGSMAARQRMVAVKGAILSLLLDAYQQRDRVGLIAFREARAELLVPPTNSVEQAEKQLRRLPTGGRTPLTAGLRLAERLLTQQSYRDDLKLPLIVVVTDGRFNVGPPPTQVALSLAGQDISALVLDSEQGFVKMGQARQLAQQLKADYLALDLLNAKTIVDQVRHRKRTGQPR